MEIDWAAFEHARVVEDVELAVTRENAPTGTGHGTDITISQLPSPWREGDMKTAARDLETHFQKNVDFKLSSRPRSSRTWRS